MNTFYVHALKDPRVTPAVPFYIDKGTGIRAWEHAIWANSTRRGQCLFGIQQNGAEIITSILAEDLTDRLKAAQIEAFGTMDTGGFLTNSLFPSGNQRLRPLITVHSGSFEKVQIAFKLLKDAVLELSQANSESITNAEVTRALSPHSDYAGGSKNYLSWSILGAINARG